MPDQDPELNTPVNPPPAAPQPSAAPAQDDDAPASKPGLGTRVLGMLSGGSTAPTINVDKTGAMSEAMTNLPPGQMFKNMLAGILTGLGSGAGQHNFVGGMGAGFNARTQQLQQQQKQDFQQAHQMSQDNANASAGDAANQASNIKAQMETTKANFEAAHKNVQLQLDNAQSIEKMHDDMAKVPGSKYEGFYKDWNAFINSVQDPEKRDSLIKAHMDGTLKSLPEVGTDDKGNPTVAGVGFYTIPKQWMDQPTSKATPIQTVDPGTGKVKYDEVPAGAWTNKEMLAYNEKSTKDAITPKDEFNQTSQTTREEDRQNHEDNRADRRDSIMMSRIAEMSKEHQPMTPDVMKSSAQTVAQYGASLNSFRFVQREMAKQGIDFVAEIKKENPNWDERTYESSAKMLNDYKSGKTFNELKASDQALQHAASLDSLLSKLPDTSNVKTLNRAIVSIAQEMNMPEINSYETLGHALSNEFERGLKGGVPDKESSQIARLQLDPAKGPKALKAVVGQYAHIMGQALSSRAGELKNGVPGVEKMQSAPNVSDGARTALGHFGLANPFDFQGTPLKDANIAATYMKKAGGNKEMARTAAKADGWSF